MGIGNLNNSFGRLTAGKAINKAVNAKNTVKAENTENTSAQVKSNSLNTSTLNEQQGKIFDSNNFGQEASAKTASKGKGKGKGIGQGFNPNPKSKNYLERATYHWHKYLDDRCMGWRDGTYSSTDGFFEQTAALGFIYGAIRGIFGGRMVSQEQQERSLEQSRGYTTNEFNNKKEHITTD